MATRSTASEVIMILGIIGGTFMLVLLVGLYVWTRRSERDIEIPTRELTPEEQQARLVRGAAVSNVVSGGGAFS